MNATSSRPSPQAAANSRRAAALSLQPLYTSVMPILTAKRSTSGLSSPEISARVSPALRASDTPMMSRKQNRFHSSPVGSPPDGAVGEHPVDVERDGLDRGHRRAPTRRSFLMIGFSRSYTHLLPSPMAISTRRMSRTSRAIPLGPERRRLIRAPHGAVQRDVALDHAGAERHRRGRGRDPRLVARVADGHAVALAQLADGLQIQLVVVRRIGAGRVQDDQILLAEHVHGVIDLLQRAHAGGEDDGAPLARDDAAAGRRRSGLADAIL